MTSKELPLSPVDHIFTGEGAYPIQLLLAFPGRVDEARLKDAFVKTLHNFWPLSSRLVEKDNRYWLVYQKDHFQFETGILDKTVDLEDPTAIPPLFLPVETFPGEVLSKVKCWWGPEHTYLAVSFAHCVADGYSFFYFLAAWSAAFHQQTIPTADHDREVLIPSARAGKITPKSVWDTTHMVWGEKARLPIRSLKLAWQVLPYPRSRLAELKAEGKTTATQTLTDNDFLVADLSRAILKEGEGPRFVGCIFDFRRIHPKLSKFYFGNAIRAAAFETTAAELRSRSLGELAMKTRQAVSSVTAEAVQRSLLELETLREQEGVQVFQKMTVADTDCGLLVTNLSRVPLEAIDFGTGKSFAIRSATPTPRTAIVLASSEGLAVVYNYPVE